MIRRRKLTIALVATLAGGAIALTGCGDDDSSSSDDATTVVETVTDGASTAAAPATTAATTAATTTSSSGDLSAGLSIPSNATSEVVQ
jgi:ABC-type oligopeptide transport system substrate-binding subunit